MQKLLGRYVNRLMLTATGRPLVAKELLGVVTLSQPTIALLKPEIVLAVLRGPRWPPLTEPPLTNGGTGRGRRCAGTVGNTGGLTRGVRKPPPLEENAL